MILQVLDLKPEQYWLNFRSMKFDDYFSFPRVLNMGPYTAEGISAQEDKEHLQVVVQPFVGCWIHFVDFLGEYKVNF